MKRESPRFVVEIEDDDEDFLSQVAAAEAQALANKRRRISVPPSPNAVVSLNSRANPKEGSDDGDGGLYTAALKGSQRAAFDPPRGGGFGRGRVNVVATGNDDVSVGGGACFKCGKPGHWARDCDAPGAAGGGGGGGYFGNYGGGDSSSSSISVPEKSCPCGFGACLVLTANTEKNRGRKFYKCPLRQENGGCGFFEWCDNASGPNAMAGGTGSVGFSRTQNYASDSSFPALECPCGGGLCLILTAKTGKNIGSQFYRCPAQEGSSCGFFKWCNEHNVAAAGVLGGSLKVQRYGSSEANNSGYGVRTGSSCFKCGKEGHWARDCPIPSYSAPVESGAARSASPGTCYKCSKPGHWARDCPSG